MDAGTDISQLLDDFEHGRVPLLEFMRTACRLREESGMEPIPELGTAVVACFGRHTEGRDLMTCILEIEGFKVIKADRDSTVQKTVEMCRDPNITVLCYSVQTTYDCPDLMNVSELLEEEGIRERIVLNIGGSPITPGLAERMGCDVYAPTAVQSVRAMKSEVLRRKAGRPQ